MGVKGLSDIDWSKFNYDIPRFESPRFDMLDMPEITTAEDLLYALKKNNEDLLQLLEQQHQANIALDKSNSRLVLLSLFLAVIPVIFGILSYFQMEKSNQLVDKQLNQFEILINRLPKVDNSPSQITPLQENNTITDPSLIQDSI